MAHKTLLGHECCSIVAHLYHLYYFEAAQVCGVASFVSATLTIYML